MFRLICYITFAIQCRRGYALTTRPYSFAFRTGWTYSQKSSVDLLGSTYRPAARQKMVEEVREDSNWGPDRCELLWLVIGGSCVVTIPIGHPTWLWGPWLLRLWSTSKWRQFGCGWSPENREILDIAVRDKRAPGVMVRSGCVVSWHPPEFWNKPVSWHAVAHNFR